MKPIVFIIFFIAYTAFGQLWLVDPLEPIYPDVNNLSDYSKNLKTDITLEGMAEVHLVLKIPKGTSFSIKAIKEGKELQGVWSQLIDVPVEQNTGIDSRTEQYLNKINPYVIRRAPFRVFEVIKPLKRKKIVANANYTALRLAIPASAFYKKGTHKIKIFVATGTIEYKGTFIVNSHNVKLPKLSESNFFYTNWFNLPKMELQHGVERWSEDWYKMLDKYAKLMAYGRQNAISLPHELFKYVEGEFLLDDEKLLGFINIFKSHGFRYFEAPHIMYRGDDDDWGDPELKVYLSKRRYYNDNGKKDVEQLMKLIYAFVKENNLENNWLQHISDEPTAVNAKCYLDVAKQIKRIYPQIKIMEATNDRDGLVGAVDIWCPLINDFQEHEDFFRQRENQGEQILVYTCLIPGGKWLNRTLDMEKLRQVYFGWGAAYYNTNGYLHWGLNQYYSNPFEQSVVKHPSPQATENNFLPAGDTHIIYPGKEGPLSSIRFEAHRLGCEDYDVLQILKQKDEKKYNKLIRHIFRSYTDYNLSIKAYRKIKRKVLKSL